MKWLWRVPVGLLLLAAIVLGGGLLWLRSGIPDYEATTRLAGLSAPVRIMRDQNAVPHIFAENDLDAYFALGYVHASERLWQMEMQRRVGAGRLSELRFIGGAGLQVDRFMRVIGAYRNAAAAYAGLPAEIKAALDAYAAGVNGWLEARDGPLPPEFHLLGLAPEPWRPADTLVWAQLIALQLSSNFRSELVHARFAERFDADRLADLFPAGTGAPPTTLAATLNEAAGAVDRLLAALPQPLGPDRASNEWVVAGRHSATGRPILVNDPHLALDAPILWFLARIETPTLSLTGASVPGVPFTLLGHNGAIAWGFTTTGSDVQDLFIERIDPNDPGRYLTPTGSEPFRIREEVIRIHGKAPVTLNVRATRHGPVLSDIDANAAAQAGADHILALAYTADVPEDIAAEALYRLNRATDWGSFTGALRLWRAPQQNIVYADVAGNIGFFAPGDIPIRRSGNGWRPVPGWTGAHDWTGHIPFEQLPQALNPADGRFINANNAVVGPDYPYLIALDYDERFRAARIAEMLDAGGPQSVGSSETMLMDNVSLAARELLPLMLTVRADDADTAEALAALRRWDHRMDRDRREPLLFETWLRELNRALYRDELGELFPGYFGLRPATVRRILTERPAWCDDVATAPPESCADILAASLKTALKSLAAEHGEDAAGWRWGDAHVAPFEHQVFSRIPVLDRLLALAIETDGGQFTVNRGASNIGSRNAPFAHVHGAGFRAVYDLSDLANSRFIIATGQSGHPLSPHYGDLVQRWRDGEHFAIAGSPDRLAGNGLAIQTLMPAE